MAARRSRFNLLLLDEGEFLLEECTAYQYIVKPQAEAGREYSVDSRQLGRMRLCTRGIFFEPDDQRSPITKFPFRGSPGCPVTCSELPLSDAILSATSSDRLDLGKLFIMQSQAAVEMKVNNVIAPYKNFVLLDLSLAKDAAATSPLRPGRARAPALRVVGSASHVPGRTTIIFALQHTPVGSLVPLAQQLWSIQLQCAAGAHSSFERAALCPILDARREGPFDISVMSDYRERPLLPTGPVAVYAERVFPLVVCPGRLMVTERAVYLLPVAINCVAGSDAVYKWPLKDVRRVLRRRRLLRETGLELILSDSAAAAVGSSGDAAGLGSRIGAPAGVFLAFTTPAVRDSVYRCILKVLRDRQIIGSSSGSAPTPVMRGAATTDISDFDSELGDPPPSALEQLTRAWQERAVSNADFLAQLNSMAGRTTSDLTQYPVFPWVISDYTSPSLDLTTPTSFRDLSKPMGALNVARVEAARARFRDMPRGGENDPPFLWGTHYSNPGYCLHYLVRCLPEHMLHLQAGRFDAPDRLFFDTSSTWAGVTSTNADVKELTPEWYFSDGNFLMLPDGLDLGVRANGRRVGGVVLPPWAFSAADFVVRCREALESEYVSSQLHNWVDLIFGYKQRGPAALAADNLFYYLTYDDAFNIESITDPDRLAALQSQIAEFGQTPRQLFSHRHPSRGGGPSLKRAMHPPEIEDDIGAESVAMALHEDPETPDHVFVKPVVFTSLPDLAWRRVSLPMGGVDGDKCAADRFPGVHSDTVTRLSAAFFETTNEGSVGIHVLSSSRDGSVALFDVVAPPPCVDDAESRSGNSAALVSPLCRVYPGAAPVRVPAPPLSSLLLLWSALYGTATAPVKPTPVSAAACDSTHSVIFSACWDGTIFAHAASDPDVVLWQSAVHNSAISDLIVIPLPQHLCSVPRNEFSKGIASITSEERADAEAEVQYILVSGAWDGSIGLSAVSVCRNPSSGSLRVWGCAATVLAPGLHSTAVTAISYSARGIAEFNVLTADASGQIVWVRIRAQAAALQQKPSDSANSRPSVILTCNVLASCSALVDSTPEAKRRASSDAISGGMSGITCLSIHQAETPSKNFGKSLHASVLITACTVDGRLCFLAGTATSQSSGYIGTERLSLVATVITGEVLRCLVVDRSGLIAVTGGHSGRLRLWNLSRVFSFCSPIQGSSTSKTATDLPPELSSSDAEFDMPGTFSVESFDALPPCSVGGSGDGRKQWITSCAIVEEYSDAFTDREVCIDAAAPDIQNCQSRMRRICILAGMQSGHVIAWLASSLPVLPLAMPA